MTERHRYEHFIDDGKLMYGCRCGCGEVHKLEELSDRDVSIYRYTPEEAKERISELVWENYRLKMENKFYNRAIGLMEHEISTARKLLNSGMPLSNNYVFSLLDKIRGVYIHEP